MRIGMIGAMSVEVLALKNKMSDVQTKTVSRIDFHSGMLCGKEVVLAVCGVGKVNAAMCAQTMILNYKPDLIINIGVAGGIGGDVSVFDVVIAESVVQHDFDLTPLGFEAGHIVGIEKAFFACAPHLVEKLSNAAKILTDTRVFKGIIATGDQFLNNAQDAKRISQTFGALAGEMEGGSIGQVCYINDVDFCVVRTISDGGDDASHMDFNEFCEAAANKSVEMITAFLESL